eukprot:TRINITY_DN877_c0_g1_i6.p1 TRINITY_DN877_c0_g1~~TRINITY_DN877_c0_g1_i6.p1  ORF type:complete len:861 (-),score=140.17 TRINITY_DN877_c0_g1_i6:1821-4403(-)
MPCAPFFIQMAFTVVERSLLCSLMMSSRPPMLLIRPLNLCQTHLILNLQPINHDKILFRRLQLPITTMRATVSNRAVLTSISLILPSQVHTPMDIQRHNIHNRMLCRNLNRKKMQNATPHEQVTAQHSQNGHLDENDVNQSPMLNTSTSSSNDAASEIRDEEFYHTSSGPEAQKDQVSDGPLHQLRDEEDVNNGELSVKQHSHSQSTINPKQVHQSIPGPGASETSQQTVLEKHVREKEAPIFDRASPGDGEGKPIQAQTQTQSGTKASSSKEPILERVGKCPGEDAGTATSGEPSSAQEADTTANDVASETPVEGQGSTQPTSEASQGTPTQTSQEPNSMPIGDGTSSEVSGIGVKKSEPEVAGDHAELDGDRPSGEQPDEVHTGTCDDPDAQNGHEGDENHSGSESVGQTVSATEVEADGRATVDADDNANENGNHDVNTADGTNVDVTTEADGDGDENANVIDEDNADVDAGSSADDHSHADVESDVADSASIAATEEPELPVYEIDPSESEPKEWHKTFDVWNVFHQRNMLDDVIHFMSNYGCDNYIPLLLNVILQQLEPVLSDDEILRLLRKCDWVWEAPALSVLSELGRDWGQRAWRLLACARTGYYGEGKEYHMFWNYVHLAGDIRDRAADVANKGSDSDSETSHSSAPDDGFTASWGQKVADNDFEFTMSLHISDVGEPWDDLSPFYLKIRLVEKEDTEISAENAKRKVTARVNVIESGCGCVLGGKAPKVGTTASSSEGTLIRSVIDGFRLLNGNPSGAGGYSYSVMNGNVLKSWLEKHTRHCGLAFHVRLYVAPSSETSSDTSSESSNGNVECTCGYCECAGCNRENEAEKESVNTENGNDAGSVNYNNS